MEVFNFRKKLIFPNFSQWKKLLRILKKEEKIALLIFTLLAFCSAIFLSLNFYFKSTTIQPAPGGVYTEGLLGQPSLVNPLYATSNDIDRDLVEILFSGLMKYDSEGKIVPDLAKNYEIKDDGKTYEVSLKDNLFWSDGENFSTDDIVFTVKTIQNPDYKSPFLSDFLGVEVEKINDKTVRFKLRNAYPPFLETLTFKILPKHIWQDIPPQNFPLPPGNLQLVGNGPFKMQGLNQDNKGFIKFIKLIPNPYYHGKKPFLSEITFFFFDKDKKEDLINAALKGKIKGISSVPVENLKDLEEKGLETHYLSLPRYFAVFFNPDEAKIFSEKEVREALNYGTNKEEIIQKVLGGKGRIVNSPFLPEIFNLSPPSEAYSFDPEKGKEILEKAGWQDLNQDGLREKVIKREEIIFKTDLKPGSRGEEVKKLQACLAKNPEIYPEGEINGFFGQKTKEAVIRFQEKYSKDILEPWGFKEGTGLVSETTRKKLNEICGQVPEETLPLKFSLVTVSQKEIEQVANLLKNQWKELGAEVEVKIVDPLSPELEQDFIKPRNYDSLLFGILLDLIPDPFLFWHSSQKKDPGLNLAIYENKEVDKLLEEARQTVDEGQRKEKYQKIQEILLEDAPAVFLYSPDYLYSVSKEIKGIKEGIIKDPSKRFTGIEEWFIKTKRR